MSSSAGGRPSGEDILRRVQKVAAAAFRCPEEKISLATTAADINGWDSLSHTVLLVNLEREFQVRFDVSKVVGFATMGDLIREIEQLAS